MPRMRLAIRSGWKTSKSSSFSPSDANRIGTPVISRTDSAAPPRASPSSLVSTTPVKPTPSRNASAVVTASWPIIESRTNSTSSGLTASRIARGLAHQLLVDAEAARGVDDDDVVVLGLGLGEAGGGDGDRDRPALIAAIVRATRRRRRGAARTPATPARSPTICSWLTAPGRCRSQATSSGVWPWSLKPLGELARQRRLTGTLQAGEHDRPSAGSWRRPACGSRRRGCRRAPR